MVVKIISLSEVYGSSDFSMMMMMDYLLMIRALYPGVFSSRCIGMTTQILSPNFPEKSW